MGKNIKKISIFFIIIIFFINTPSASVAMNDNLKWFGPVNIGKDNISEVASWANLVMIGQDLNITDPYITAQMDVDAINLASQYGAKGLLECFNIFFSYDANSGIIALRDNYYERWMQFASVIASHKRHIWGILTLDEPFLTALRQGWGVRNTRNIINEINSLIKKSFPNVNTVGALRIIKSDLLGMDDKYLLGAYVPPGSYDEYGIPTYDVVGTFFYHTVFCNRSDYTISASDAVSTTTYTLNADGQILMSDKTVMGTYQIDDGFWVKIFHLDGTYWGSMDVRSNVLKINEIVYYAEWNSKCSVDDFKMLCGSRVGELYFSCLPWQKIVLIPGMFYNTGRYCEEAALLNISQACSDFSQQFSKVIAIVPFLYRSVGNMTGLQDLPVSVQTKWQNIGKEIIK